MTQANFVKGIASVNSKGVYEEGNYTVTSSIQSTDSRIVLTGTLNVAQVKNIDVYVAETGDDENGDGSEDNPYRTVDKGIDVSLNSELSGNLYVKCGIYNLTKLVQVNN